MTDPSDFKVLHVDDEPDFVEVAADILEREDSRFSVKTATSATEGVDRLSVDNFDCIVSDYQMPGQNGIEFLETIREEHPDLPFILYTGKGSREVACDTFSAAATEYLQKRSGTDQYELLANRIKNAIEQNRAQQRTAELERIRTLVTDLNLALIRAESRLEAETRVCELISDSDPYRFAWIGEIDSETGRAEPRAWAGVEADYLDDITVTDDDIATEHGPGGTAIREGRVAVTQNVQEDPEFEPWREEALERGYRAVAAVPLEYKDTLYGALVVYANRPDAFDEDERALLAGLGGDLGHTIHSLEAQRTLERFKKAVSHAGHAVYLTDGKGTIEYANPAFETITGYSAEEAVDRNPRIFKSGEMSDAYYEELWESLLDGNVWEEEVINRRQDGELYYAHQTIAPILDENDIEAFVAIQTDITDQKEHEQEIQRQISRLSEFASVVSPDLRNPLTVAQGRAMMLQERCDGESHEHLDTIVTALERMERIIEDTLTLARQGETVGEMSAIPVTGLVQQCWEGVETVGATLEIADEFTVRGDCERLRHVFENLFRNAVEHGGDDVTVRVGRVGEDRFYVEDDGLGIPAGDRETVFEAGHTSATEGTGFGLTIVKRIAEAHGWEVTITDGRDDGARFEFDTVEVISE